MTPFQLKQRKNFEEQIKTWDSQFKPVWKRHCDESLVLQVYLNTIDYWFEYITDKKLSPDIFHSAMFTLYKKLQTNEYRGLFVGSLARLTIEHSMDSPFIKIFTNIVSLDSFQEMPNLEIKTKELINTYWMVKAFNLDTLPKINSDSPFYPCQLSKNVISYKNKLNIEELFIKYNIAPNFIDDMNVKNLITTTGLATLFKQNHHSHIRRVKQLNINLYNYKQKLNDFLEDKEIRLKWASNATDDDIIDHYLGFLDILYKNKKSKINVDIPSNYPTIIEMIELIKDKSLRNMLIFNKDIGASNNVIIDLLKKRHLQYEDTETSNFDFIN